MASDLTNLQGLEQAQQQFMKGQRENQHALAIIALHLAMHKYRQGLLASTELMSEVFTIVSTTHPLRVGDMDLVLDLEVETEQAFMQRLDASFAQSRRSQ